MSFIYNPQNQTYEELLESFVLRQKEFKSIQKDLEHSNLTNLAQHYLIEGQRGSGKTSLLLRIKYEILHNKKLSSLLPIQFAEEQYNIFNLARLWESCADRLEEQEGFEDINEELEKLSKSGDYDKEIFPCIEKYLKHNKKRLVLLLDNFGDILNKFSLREQQRLRDIFHTSHHIQFITSSSVSLEHTYKHDKPFFEFFQIIRLKGLNNQETITLLNNLARNDQDMQGIIANEPSRIETIRRLTGGVPRTIVLLFEILLDKSADIFEDLEQMLDKTTPLYKHRMDDLPTQQQAIVDAIAQSWDGISTKEIVSSLKSDIFDSKKISSQLTVLETNGILVSKKIDKKNKIYFIQERFFNIWYLMRYGRKKKQQHVKWLVRFLQEWCNETILQQKANHLILSAREGKLNARGGYYMAVALSESLENEELKGEVLSETKEYLKKQGNPLSHEMPLSLAEILQQADQAYQDKDFKNAKRYYEMAVEKGDSRAMNNLAVLYKEEYKDIENTKRYYEMAVEKGHSGAMFNLALLYENAYKDIENAKRYYEMAIEKGDSGAMFNLALLYEDEYKDIENAKRYYEMAIEKGHSGAMNNLALLYEDEYKDIEHAKRYYEMAIEKGYSGAIYNLAFLYYEQHQNKQKAISLIEQSISLEKDLASSLMLSKILLWDNQYKNSIQAFYEFMQYSEAKEYLEFTIDYFLLLLAKQQYHGTYKLFQEFAIFQDMFKPIYFAILSFLQEEYPKEYLKMGDELAQTVEEILDRVKEIAQDYKD